MEYSHVIVLKNISSTPVVLLAILRYIITRQGKQLVFNGISLLSGEHHLAWVRGSSIRFWVTPSLEVMFVFLMYPLWIFRFFQNWIQLDKARKAPFIPVLLRCHVARQRLWIWFGTAGGIGPLLKFIGCISQRCRLFWYATRMVWGFLHLWVRPVATLKSDPKRALRYWWSECQGFFGGDYGKGPDYGSEYGKGGDYDAPGYSRQSAWCSHRIRKCSWIQWILF